VLDIRVPEVAPADAADLLPGRLLELWPKFLTYVTSFLVVAVYWLDHHRMFRYIKRYDERLIWMNLALLMTIAFLPFPKALVSAYPGQHVAVVFYAATLMVTGLLSSALWRYAAGGHRLVDEGLDVRLIRYMAIRTASIPAVFLLSIGVSFIHPISAMLAWLTIALTRPALNRLYRL
jgi:uncharacterized membrane protein